MINKKLTPFRWCMLQSFPFIEATFDAIDNYGLLCKIIEYVNKNIDKTNELGIKVEELNNWFTSLDVQEEINKKLDEMAESGELQEIIAQYLQLAGILAYNTLNDMKNAENIVAGSFIKTFGYDYFNDKKGAFYKARNLKNTDLIDNITIVALKDENLVAELIKNEEYIKKSYGVADHLGVGNETVTKAGDSFSTCVQSIRANRSYTLPDNIVAPGIFTPSSSKDCSLYSGRDSVALFVANEGRPPYLSVNASDAIYTYNSVTYPENSNIEKIENGMVIDLSDGSAGLIIDIDKENHKFIIEDNWYKNGEKVIPEDLSYEVGKITKLWTSNTIVKLKKDMPQRLAVGEEMDLDNYITDEDFQMVGHDVVTTANGKATAGYLARTGAGSFDSGSIGRLESGFVAQNVNNGFITESNRLKDILLASFNHDHQITKDSVRLYNDGEMTNIKNQVQILTADNQEAPARCKYWIFKPTEDINYTLPDIANDDPDYWNNREFIFVNRSNYNVTLSNGYTITPYNSAIFITFENLWIRIFPE